MVKAILINFIIVLPTSKTLATPTGLIAGAYTIAILNDATVAGSASLPYTAYAAPTVSSLDLSYGPVGGGTTVVITGTGFVDTGVVLAQFGGAAATGCARTSCVGWKKELR